MLLGSSVPFSLRPALLGSRAYRRPGMVSRIGLNRRTCNHRSLTCAKAAEQAPASPPKPNPRFARTDLRRIKQQGPSVEDLHAHYKVEVRDKEGDTIKMEYDFVPPEVLGAQPAAARVEPAWNSLPQMTFMEFYHGLRQRNWTSQHYTPHAEPWSVQFYKDSGRFLRPAFPGYRALITRADGSQAWANLDHPGEVTFLSDYTAGGTHGAIHKSKRHSSPLMHPSQYGYNQVFQEVFEAQEQRLDADARRQWRDMGWVEKAAGTYACPADRQLQVSYHMTPAEVSLRMVWEYAPAVAFYAFGISFLGVALAIGIFAPRRQMPTDIFAAMEFAQSKGNARKDGSTGISFQEVGGLGSTIHEMQEVVEFLKDPKRWSRLEAKPPKGILLEGPPGTGKTLIAKAIAGEARVPFYQMAGSEFVEAIVGVGAARVRDLFKRARVNAPCIIFVDEIDALGIKRAEAGVVTNEEREQTLNQLLSEMDGFTPDIGVVFVAATNRSDLLDPALMRAGRFDRKIMIRRPDEQGRYEVLQIHARKHPLSPDVDLQQLAKDLPGLSGAELGNVLNEAALETVRRRGEHITQDDVYNAVDRVLQGIRRPPMPDYFTVKRTLAVHEAGVGLLATLLHRRSGRIEEVERVSLVARGSDWSRTIFARGRDEEYLIMTKGRLLDRIRVVLAGRAAEEVALGDVSTYGVKDLQDATRLALRCVANYGMSAVGITTYAPVPPGMGFMQKSFEVTVDNIDQDLFGNVLSAGGFQPSDDNWHRIKTAVHSLVLDAYNANLYDLACHKPALEAAAEALLEREMITGKELEALMEVYPPRDPPPEGVKRQPAEPDRPWRGMPLAEALGGEGEGGRREAGAALGRGRGMSRSSGLHPQLWLRGGRVGVQAGHGGCTS